MLSLLLRLLTPIVLAIVTFIVIFVVADATATGTDRFSSMSTRLEAQSVLVRRLIQATRETLSETTSHTLMLRWANDAASLSDQLSASMVSLNSVQQRTTGE